MSDPSTIRKKPVRFFSRIVSAARVVSGRRGWGLSGVRRYSGVMLLFAKSPSTRSLPEATARSISALDWTYVYPVPIASAT
jgi:hypothetical protein